MNDDCRHGKETVDGELSCSLCADSFSTVKPKRIWLFTICFSILLLILAGMLFWGGRTGTWDSSWDRLMGRPIAMINGEAIGREDFMTRLATIRRILELQYGGEIFTDKAGEARLLALKKSLLDRMVEERLIAQEARRLGLHITEEMVEQELRRIGSEIYGSVESLEKMLGEDGITHDALRNLIRNGLTSQALAKAKAQVALADMAVQPEVNFDNWLRQEKKMATVIVYDSSANAAVGSAGVGECCDP